MVGIVKLRITIGGKIIEKESRKRGAEEINETIIKKKQKVDEEERNLCLRLLREHKFGWVFREPVDPVRLNIPDYSSVVSKPMDLGTMESKLTTNLYESCDDFASDVRLTFNNAMLYHPPDNIIHKMAKEFKEVFEERWKKPLKVQSTKVEQVSKKRATEADVSLLLKPVKGQIKKLDEKKASPATPMPLEKALRTTILKGQFAEAILRAKGLDRISLQIEKQEMETRLHQEKAIIEEEMRVARATMLKPLRDRERLELESMKMEPDFQDNHFMSLHKDMFNLCGSSDYLTRSKLHELGLILRKDDDVELEESLWKSSDADDLEDGEIFD